MEKITRASKNKKNMKPNLITKADAIISGFLDKLYYKEVTWLHIFWIIMIFIIAPIVTLFTN